MIAFVKPSKDEAQIKLSSSSRTWPLKVARRRYCFAFGRSV